MSASKPKASDFVLYHDPGSYYAALARVMLEEKAIPWTSYTVLMLLAEQMKPRYLLTVTDRGVVPMLFHKGQAVPNFVHQMEYLDEHFPDSGTRLYPADPAAKAKVTEWVTKLDNAPVFTITFGAGFYKDRFANPKFPPPMPMLIRHINNVRLSALQKHSAAAKSERLKAILDTRQKAAQALVEQWKTPAALEAALIQMDELLTEMEAQLRASGGPWLTGASYHACDVIASCMVFRLWFLGLEARAWASRPLLAAYFKLSSERPQFKAGARGWWELPPAMMGPAIGHFIQSFFEPPLLTAPDEENLLRPDQDPMFQEAHAKAWLVAGALFGVFAIILSWLLGF